MLRPFIWEEFLCRNWTVAGGLEAIVDESGLVVEFAQGTESENEIHAADKARIVLNIFHIVEGTEPAFKIGAENDRAVDVEMRKVDVDDSVDHFAVFRQPNGEFGCRWR